jgi:uncharacterized membrane protein YciS (DUF1049 family)
MNMSTLIASLLTVVFVLGLIIFRLLWAASQVASLAGLGRLPKLPKSWRRWLFDEHNDTST